MGACSMKGSRATESSLRRKRIAEIVRWLESAGEGCMPWQRSRDHARQCVKLVDDLLTLYDQENIHLASFWQEACVYSFQCYLVLGHKDKAALWARSAYDYSLLYQPNHIATLR